MEKAEGNRVRVSFMSEEPCMNWGVPEIMLSTKEAADLNRVESGVAPVLFNHDRDKIVGRMENIEFEDGKGYADVVFDEDDESQKIKAKVESGSLRGVSVGYMRQQVTEVYPNEIYMGRFKGPCEVVDKWELLEFSIVSIPADPTVGVGRDLQNKGDEQMKDNENKPVEPTITEDDVRAAAEAARKAENKRVRGIRELCHKHNIDAANEDKFISDGTNLDGVRSAILDILATKEAPLKAKVTHDEGDKLVRAISAGLGMRYGLEKTEDREAMAYGRMSLQDIAKDVLSMESPSEARSIHLAAPENVLRRAMSSSSFVGIVDEFTHKSMGKAYNERPVTFDRLVSKGSNSDFKTAYRYTIGLDDLPTLMAAESGEFTYGNVEDQKVGTNIHTYGKGIKLTREIFINDQLGEVNMAIAMQGKGYRRLQEIMFYKLFQDASHFSEKLGNLVKTNKNVSTKAFSEMERLMLEQKSFDGKGFIGVEPRFVVVPTSISGEVAQLLTSTSDPTSTNSGVANIWNGRLTMIQSPYLTNTDEKAYYFVADPSEIPGIEYTTLNGNDTPISRTVPDTEDLGLAIQSYMDFGFNLLGVQGFVKNENNA